MARAARPSCGQARARCGGSPPEAAAAEIVLEIAGSSPARSESARSPPPPPASAPSGSATGCLGRWLPSRHRRTLAPPPLSSAPGSSTPPSHSRRPPPRAAPPPRTTGAARAVPPRDRLRSLRQCRCRVASTSAEPPAGLLPAWGQLCIGTTGETARWNKMGGTLIDESDRTARSLERKGGGGGRGGKAQATQGEKAQSRHREPSSSVFYYKNVESESFSCSHCMLSVLCSL